MIRLRTAQLVALWSVCALANGRAFAQDIRTVMVVRNEICLKSNNGQIVSLTHDGAPKALPAWSKDGNQVAFIEVADKVSMLARLKVIGQDGSVVSEIPIKPSSLGEVQSGMETVESLEWLTSQSIAVSGAMNPSTTEYDIFDVKNHEVARQFFDEGHGAGFSPDGKHFAYVSGSPHFTPTADRLPTLNVDDKAVYSANGVELEFSGPPEWSQDSRSVAIPAVQKGEQRVVIWREGGELASIPLPFPPGSSTFSLSWIDNRLYSKTKSFVVSSDANQPSSPGKRSFTVSAWVLQMGAGTDHSWRSVESEAVPNATANAEVMRKRLKAVVEMSGGLDPDFWCAKCDLSVLPRRSGATR